MHGNNQALLNLKKDFPDLTRPQMIVFDYGGTLLYEPNWDPRRGNEALFKHIKTNKNNLSPEELHDFSQQLFAQLSQVRSLNYEIHEWQFQKLLYEYLEIELALTPPETEKVFWDHTSAGAVMPGADRMIDFINRQGIRSGVISNISFSGQALAERINRLLPNNRFEFILASSEYGIRKPNRLLFDLAPKKAGLDPSALWFSGDNQHADIAGAASAGIFPVWYRDRSVDDPFMLKDSAGAPPCAHLDIFHWDELVEILENLS
ncbi:MAG TPA: HAD family hydrolase [Clostridiales bacterium]|nr:HAD family hydrolase [Clostridiales bacterium]